MGATNAARLATSEDALLNAGFAKVVPLLPCLLALAGMGGCTWVCFHLGQPLASVGFLYLVFVVLAAVYGGFWQATLISVISVACLDYFFDEPIFQFQRRQSVELGGTGGV